MDQKQFQEIIRRSQEDLEVLKSVLNNLEPEALEEPELKSIQTLLADSQPSYFTKAMNSSHRYLDQAS